MSRPDMTTLSREKLQAMIVLRTPRLHLKTWSLDDFDAFAVLARDRDVMRYIAEGRLWPDSRIGWFLGRQSVLQEVLGFCNWKLTEPVSGDLIGFCGLAPLPSIDEIEIGWWLKPHCWGKGLATEAAARVVEAAFVDHGLSRIVARAYRANTRSIALMERLGMHFERVLNSGPSGEIVLYGLEAGDR